MQQRLLITISPIKVRQSPPECDIGLYIVLLPHMRPSNHSLALHILRHDADLEPPMLRPAQGTDPSTVLPTAFSAASNASGVSTGDHDPHAAPLTSARSRESPLLSQGEPPASSPPSPLVVPSHHSDTAIASFVARTDMPAPHADGSAPSPPSEPVVSGDNPRDADPSVLRPSTLSAPSGPFTVMHAIDHALDSAAFYLPYTNVPSPFTAFAPMQTTDYAPDPTTSFLLSTDFLAPPAEAVPMDRPQNLYDPLIVDPLAEIQPGYDGFTIDPALLHFA